MGDSSTRRLLNVIIVLAMVWFVIRVTQVESREGGFPFQSANDRSRWCTVRALVDHGTYAIDDVILHKRWDTIDKVAHPGRDGQLHYYSSKPTLLPTLLAIPYWLLQKLTGWTLEQHPLQVGRTIVGLVNGALLLALFIPLRNILLRYAPDRETAVFVMLAATWGTYLTSFAVTINNHLVAAAGIMLSAAGFLDIERRSRELLRVTHDADGRPAHARGVLAFTGMAAAFAVTNELPAMSYFALLTIALFWLPVATVPNASSRSKSGTIESVTNATGTGLLTPAPETSTRSVGSSKSFEGMSSVPANAPGEAGANEM